MRPDMHEVIIERPRIQGVDRKPKYLINEETDLPSKEGMRRNHKERKRLNENLAPLKRFVRSRCGRKWNDVFSEICENISLDSAVKKHILEHLQYMVEKEITLIDGIPHTFKSYSGLEPLAGVNYHYATDHFYVDPEDGILKRVFDKKRPKDPPRAPFKVPKRIENKKGPFIENEFYDLIDGNWYQVKVKWALNYSWKADYQKDRYGRTRWIQLSAKSRNIAEKEYKYNAEQHLKPYFKRQLSKKDIKKLKENGIIF
jgi:hypothetical protein